MSRSGKCFLHPTCDEDAARASQPHEANRRGIVNAADSVVRIHEIRPNTKKDIVFTVRDAEPPESLRPAIGKTLSGLTARGPRFQHVANETEGTDGWTKKT